ncbi:MAG: cytochrome c [bacterium]|nr:cytochrome c [bacterium]
MKRRAQSTTILGALVAAAAAVTLAWAPPVSADMHEGYEGPDYGGHGHVHIFGHGSGGDEHGTPAMKETIKHSLTSPGDVDHEAMGDPEKGRAMFQQNCVACHGVSGKGDGPLAKVLTPKPADLTSHMGHRHSVGLSRHDYLFKVITGGGASVGKSPAMPKWEGQLKTEEVCDVIKYLQAFSAREKPGHTETHKSH